MTECLDFTLVAVGVLSRAMKYSFLLIYLFVCFWLHWVFIAARGLSLVAASGGYSSLQCAGFSLRWLLLLRGTGSRHAGFSSCGSRALERRISSCSAQALLLHVESSRSRARTRVPCIGGWILNHYAAREVLLMKYSYLHF